MAIANIGELLDHTTRFEAHLSDYYAAICERTPDNDVKLFTYYLSRHRRDLAAVLNAVTARDLARVRRIGLPALAYRPEDAFGPLNADPAAVTGRALAQAVVGYHRELTALYRTILKLPVDSRARALLERLVRLEERSIRVPETMLTSDYF